MQHQQQRHPEIEARTHTTRHRNSFSIKMELFSLNCRGLGSSLRLAEVCSLIKKTKNSPFFVAALQETKLTELTTEHKKVLQKEKFKYIITPSVYSSGGLICIFPENMDVNKVSECKGCQAVLSSSENTLIINSYINPRDTNLSEFVSFLEKLNFEKYQKVYVVGDHNAINPDDLNRPFYSNVKKHDIRLLRFKKLDKILGHLAFVDIAKNTPPIEPTHYDKKNKAMGTIGLYLL